jgi:asparagine synthase (glutamine-hydrolysing)
MCGLVTIISPNPDPRLADIARAMLDAIAHRGPDGSGVATFDHRSRTPLHRPATIALAHARLAIQDPSDVALQPMSTHDDQQHLSFNGEIYNFLELRQQLHLPASAFRSGSDTEVLLHLLTHFGPSALTQLDGMFALCFLNLHNNTLLLARDPFGIKPLYLWQASNGHLCIASEIKAFTAHPNWEGSLNRLRALDFLNRGLIDHTNDTLFKGVLQLPAGSLSTIQLDRAPAVEPKVWHQIGQYPTSTPTTPLVETLATSVRLRMRSDVPVGSCLSGGVDSSGIVALAMRAREASAAAPFHAIHARPLDGAADEWPSAEALASHVGCQLHQVRPQGTELFDRLDELVWAHDEPFSSPSIFAQFKVFEAARQLGLKVMLDGQGADEVFGGYHAFFTLRQCAAYTI